MMYSSFPFAKLFGTKKLNKFLIFHINKKIPINLLEINSMASRKILTSISIKPYGSVL